MPSSHQTSHPPMPPGERKRLATASTLWEARAYLLRHHPQCPQAKRLAAALERVVDDLLPADPSIS